MQPQPVVKPFFPGTEHLVDPLPVSVELERRGVTDELSGLGAFIYVRVHERQFRELVAHLAESWEDLAADSTPGKVTKEAADEVRRTRGIILKEDFQRTGCLRRRSTFNSCPSNWVPETYHEAP